MFCDINNVFTFLIQYKIIDKKTPWIETFLVYLDIVQSNVINQSLSSAVSSQPDPDLSPLEISVAPLIKYMTYPTCFSRIRLFLWKVISVENRHFFFFYFYYSFNDSGLFLTVKGLHYSPPCTCVRAEHSTYLTALRSRASFSPLSQDRARCLFLASFSRVLLSSLRSTWVPTSRKGVRGQWCEISGTHY